MDWRGAKCINYFISLENRNYSNKVISIKARCILPIVEHNLNTLQTEYNYYNALYNELWFI